MLFQNGSPRKRHRPLNTSKNFQNDLQLLELVLVSLSQSRNKDCSTAQGPQYSYKNLSRLVPLKWTIRWKSIQLRSDEKKSILIIRYEVREIHFLLMLLRISLVYGCETWTIEEVKCCLPLAEPQNSAYGLRIFSQIAVSK